MKLICVLPGDGIGPEVVGCAVEVLSAVAPGLEFVHSEIGQRSLDEHGTALTEDTLDLMRDCDSTLFGAVTSVPGEDHRPVVPAFRKALGLYVNVRPVRSIHRTALRLPIDVVVVRENSEGLYNQPEVRDEHGVTTHRRVTRSASERVVEFALGYARTHGRRKVTCVHKANVLKASDGLFLQTFRDIMTAGGGGLEWDDQLVDSAGMLLVTAPSRFDVLVTLNLYGDILSDVAAGIAGGLGFAPSGNIGAEHSVFEPAHGSAPDIAGKGLANPTAAMLSGAMMLEHIGMAHEARAVREAVDRTYSEGHLTIDVGGSLDSSAFTRNVIRALRA